MSEQTSYNALLAEVETLNAALTSMADLLDAARMERDRALAQCSTARAEVERLNERHYTSTACHHGLHESCGKAQHDRGEDGAPHCKFCPEPCRCACHGEVRDGE